MFFDIYSSLCKKVGKKPSAVAEELGINKSNVSNWKNNGYTPRGDALQKISDYFGVTTDYLLGNEEKAPTTNSERIIDVLNLSDLEKDIILAFRNSDTTDRNSVLRILRIDVEERKTGIPGVG